MENEIINKELSGFQLEKEIERMQLSHRKRNRLTTVFVVLLVLAASMVLAATLKFPILLVGGDAMNPTLESGQALLTIRTQQLERGDIVAFYHGNELLIRRIVGCSGEQIHIADDGLITVNGETFEDVFSASMVLEPSDLTYPIQVPESCFFVVGDNRAISMDSRMMEIGCVSSERIVGKVIFRFWPLEVLAYLG